MTQTTTAASETVPRATLDELVAEPGRVADQAERHPVRIDRTDGGAELVLLSAIEFDRRFGGPGPRVRLASEWSDEELERLAAAPIPEEAAAFDDEGGFLEPER